MMENSGVPFTMDVVPAGSNCNGNNGMWGGDWSAWIILFLIFAMFGWGGYGGFGGNGGGYGVGSAYTDATIQRGFDNQSVMNKLNGLENGLCDGFYAVNTTLLNGFSGVNAAIAQNGYQAQQCCCETNRNIDSVRFENAQNTCAITNAIHAEGEQTRALINANTMQDLRDKLAERDRDVLAANFKLSQSDQNAFLRATMEANTAEVIRRTGSDCPIPAYVVPNPNCCYGTPYGVLGNFNGVGNYNGGCGCNGGCGNYA